MDRLVRVTLQSEFPVVDIDEPDDSTSFVRPGTSAFVETIQVNADFNKLVLRLARNGQQQDFELWPLIPARSQPVPECTPVHLSLGEGGDVSLTISHSGVTFAGLACMHQLSRFIKFCVDESPFEDPDEDEDSFEDLNQVHAPVQVSH
jgi:hypothetical protein